MSVGPWQIAIIALVVLLLFGATRLGDIGKGLGEGIRNFKKGISDDDPDDSTPSTEGSDPKQLKADDEGAEASSETKSTRATEAEGSAKKDA
jgi:sec-independent protein translocase protein TatA